MENRQLNFTEFFPLQFYINLDKRQDRDILVQKEFKKINIDPVRISGTVIKTTSNAMWNGILGCLLSHTKCLETALEQKENIFIFEDDILFTQDNQTQLILDQCCKELSVIDWDMFYVAANILKPIYQISKHLGKLTHAQSTVGYGVNKDFVKKLLSYIPRHKIIPIDLVYSNNVVPKHNCFISIPMLGVQRDSFSDIEGRSVQYESYLQKRYDANLIYSTNGEDK